ncbi:threonine dehydratase [Seongchinamella unica]|uniref:Threonine dehydratase n=1 Tax=Seongchinamella unica TaxID=2547392 RepID=A0A4R5LPN8_9GAMM|nr:threonine dehydratase [Seongchinamella unica]TDG12441.1 threonine dehydratase [Seongchinamella unica]
MLSLSLEDLQCAAEIVYRQVLPTPQINWPLLSERCGCEVWVKHENHNLTGAFKVRGGLVYMQRLLQREPDCPGVVTATRGNHGQSVALAAGLNDLPAIIVVPEGNSSDKNRAMAALGGELIVHGRDFNASVEHAAALAATRGLHRMPSFHSDLVAGVASYALEFFRAQPGLQRVYVPIGLGSGICGMISARNALGLDVQIVGVVATGAPCYQRSLAAGKCISTDTADTFADGLAVRVPDPQALALMQGNVDEIVAVSDAQISQAMTWLFSDTHNVAEGAGAAALAALYQQRERNRGSRVGVVLSGGNVDASLYSRILLQQGG